MISVEDVQLIFGWLAVLFLPLIVLALLGIGFLISLWHDKS